MRLFVAVGQFEDESQPAAALIGPNHEGAGWSPPKPAQLVGLYRLRLIKVLGWTLSDSNCIVKAQAMFPQMLISHVVSSDASPWNFWHRPSPYPLGYTSRSSKRGPSLQQSLTPRFVNTAQP